MSYDAAQYTSLMRKKLKLDHQGSELSTHLQDRLSLSGVGFSEIMVLSFRCGCMWQCILSWKALFLGRHTCFCI